MKSTLKRIAEIQNQLDGYNLCAQVPLPQTSCAFSCCGPYEYSNAYSLLVALVLVQILSLLSSPNDALLREVLALQAILLFNANRKVQKSLFNYFIHTREEVCSLSLLTVQCSMFSVQILMFSVHCSLSTR